MSAALFGSRWTHGEPGPVVSILPACTGHQFVLGSKCKYGFGCSKLLLRGTFAESEQVVVVLTSHRLFCPFFCDVGFPKRRKGSSGGSRGSRNTGRWRLGGGLPGAAYRKWRRGGSVGLRTCSHDFSSNPGANPGTTIFVFSPRRRSEGKAPVSQKPISLPGHVWQASRCLPVGIVVVSRPATNEARYSAVLRRFPRAGKAHTGFHMQSHHVTYRDKCIPAHS